MGRLSREDYINAVSALAGERTDEETLNHIANLSDTYVDTAEIDNEWQQKYNELNNSWREKYKRSFLSGAVIVKEQTADVKSDDMDVNTKISFDDLFRNREG